MLEGIILNLSISFQVEVKPYVLDDQLCDECQGARCGGKFAPFFCANVTCLQVSKPPIFGAFFINFLVPPDLPVCLVMVDRPRRVFELCLGEIVATLKPVITQSRNKRAAAFGVGAVAF